MDLTEPVVQLKDASAAGNTSFDVSDRPPRKLEVQDRPPKQRAPVGRFTVDLPEEIVDFVEFYAEYRNALAQRKGIEIEEWTRKSMAEELIRVQAGRVRFDMTKAFAKLGDIPKGKDKEAMAAYVRRALELFPE